MWYQQRSFDVIQLGDLQVRRSKGASLTRLAPLKAQLEGQARLGPLTLQVVSGPFHMLGILFFFF